MQAAALVSSALRATHGVTRGADDSSRRRFEVSKDREEVFNNGCSCGVKPKQRETRRRQSNERSRGAATLGREAQQTAQQQRDQQGARPLSAHGSTPNESVRLKRDEREVAESRSSEDDPRGSLLPFASAFSFNVLNSHRDRHIDRGEVRQEIHLLVGPLTHAAAVSGQRRQAHQTV